MDTIITPIERHEGDPLQPSDNLDRWVLCAPLATLSGTFLLLLLCGLPGLLSFILIPVTILGVPLAGLGLLVWSLASIFRKKWRRGVSVFIAIALPIVLFQQIIWTAECVHLGLTIGLGVGELGDTLPGADARFQTHDWSVGLVTNPSTFLLYDVTDEIARPLEGRGGRLAPKSVIEAQCTGRARHLLGHYYVCSF